MLKRKINLLWHLASLARNILDCISSKLCKRKKLMSIWREFHQNVTSKITRKQTRCKQNTDVIALLTSAIHKSDFVDETANDSVKRIYSFEITLYENFMIDVGTWRSHLPNTTAFRIAIFRFFCETCAPKSWALARWKSN